MITQIEWLILVFLIMFLGLAIASWIDINNVEKRIDRLEEKQKKAGVK